MAAQKTAQKAVQKSGIDTVVGAINFSGIPNTMLGSIADHVVQAIVQASDKAIDADTVRLEIAPNPGLGDLTFRCFEYAKHIGLDPAAAASALQGKLQPSKMVAEWKAAGPYLNIKLSRNAVAAELIAAMQDPNAFTSSSMLKNEEVMIEYVQPNTNKPLHIGHVRNGLLGWSLAELLKSQGAKVHKVDIINDRGIHITKSMYAYSRWGDGATPEDSGEKGDHFVGRWYVMFQQQLQAEKIAWLEKQNIDLAEKTDREKEEIDRRFLGESALMAAAQEMLRKWEEGDEKVRALWKQMNDWVYAGFTVSFNNLGIDFDRHYYESEIYQGGKDIILKAAEEGRLRREENGAIVAPLSETSNLPDKVLLRGDHTALYITQDINLAALRFAEYPLTKMLYVIGSEQHLYTQQLFAVMKLLGFEWADRLVHLEYGLVNLPEGKMKSREGKVVDADDLLAEMTMLAREEMDARYSDISEAERAERAGIVALAAMKFHFLAVSKDSVMTFDPKASLSFEGKTGPYLLYTYARAQSILRKAGERSEYDMTVSEDAEWNVVRALLAYPAVLQRAATAHDPALLANYLIMLGQAFNTFYHECAVLQAEDNAVRSSRLALTQSLANTLRHGLSILGIKTLEVM